MIVVEADLLGIGDTVGEPSEGFSVVEIRGVNDVSGSAELIGEGEAAGRQSLRMMEEQKLGHGCSLARLLSSDRRATQAPKSVRAGPNAVTRRLVTLTTLDVGRFETPNRVPLHAARAS